MASGSMTAGDFARPSHALLQRAPAIGAPGREASALRPLLLVCLSAGLLAASTAAQAQQSIEGAASATPSQFRRDRNISVLERPHPEYEALGIRAGGFMIWPKLNTTLEHNSNVFAVPDNTQADTLWRVTPELDLNSNWSRHMVAAYARSTLTRYSSLQTENTTDYSLGATGRLDVRRSAKIEAGLDGSRLTEPRTAAESQGLNRPIRYNLVTAYLKGEQELNRLRFSGRLDWSRYDYLDRAENPPQDDRDHTVLTGTARADYAVSPETALFVQVAANRRDYRLSSSPLVLRGGVATPVYPDFHNRDSSGAEVLLGANFELSALVRGELGAGYLRQTFSDSAFPDVSGLGARGRLEWFPTGLTTVTFTGSRTIEDSGLVGSAGVLVSSLAGEIDHELLRNLILTGRTGYSQDSYRGIARRDHIYSAALSATYLLNRRMGVTLGYDYLRQDSEGANQGLDFSQNRFLATLALQY